MGLAQFFEEVAAAENTYNSTIKQVQKLLLVGSVIKVAPKIYRPVLITEHHWLGEESILDDLEDTTMKQWRSGNEVSGNSDEEDKQALSEFIGKCLKYDKKI